MQACQKQCPTKDAKLFCGKDGKPYLNECQAKCHGKKIRKLKMFLLKAVGLIFEA